jgi:hypothetical protein
MNLRLYFSKSENPAVPDKETVKIKTKKRKERKLD